jgi:putative ABC transport system permease protein
MDLAIKDVQRHAGKFATTIAGVGLLIAVVLTMNGIYRGNIADGVWIIENSDVDLWVVERARGGPFNEPSRVSQGLYRSVAAVPGVAKASPYIVYAVQRDIAGKSQQFSIIGYDVLGGLGGPRGLIAGRPIAAAHYEAVADAALRLHLGDRTRLGLHDYTIVGLTRGAVDTGGNPLVYMALPDAQDVLYQQDNEAVRSARVATVRAIEGKGYLPTDASRLLPVASGTETQTISAVLVKLTPDADLEGVRAGVQQRLFLSVYSSEEERQLMLGGRLLKIIATLGVFRTLLVLVSVVIMALIVYVLTMEKIRAIATLKLIGAPNSVIVRLILEQSLVLAVLGFAAAYGLVAATHSYFPRTLVFVPFDTIVTFAVVFVGGVIASFFAIWRALKTPPSLALGG